MFTNRLMRRLLRSPQLKNYKLYRKAWATDKYMYDPLESADHIEYSQQISKHRVLLPLYDLEPLTNDNYIAATATIVGEVHINPYATIWNNVVIRGDINAVVIGDYSSIGDNTVVQTVASLATGLPAR